MHIYVLSLYSMAPIELSHVIVTVPNLAQKKLDSTLKAGELSA